MLKKAFKALLEKCKAKVKASPFLFNLFKSSNAGRLINKAINDIQSTYPISIPSIKVDPSLDFLLLELPPRYIPMMPNGIGYVHNILKKTGIGFQTIDLNVITYHQFHSKRILEKMPVITTGGYEMKEDPWDNTNTAEWERPEVIEYFLEKLEGLIRDIAYYQPKAVGISVQANSRQLANALIKVLRARAPEVAIVIGGYDCVYHYIGPYLVPDFDYMAIGDTELTLEPLVKGLARGERPKDLPGIISRYDSPDRKWANPPLLEYLDLIDFPKYEWIASSMYQNFNGGHLVPIVASRGCKWSRCRFCSECFTFRKRSPQKVVDEIEFWTSRNFSVFHFNDSDVNGDPQHLYDICSEIIRRGLKVTLVGQLRVDKHNNKEYFEHLLNAGFRHLRFGVDGWTDVVLRILRKGYNMKLVKQNLKDCHESGIYTTINIILGVPGETEDDIDASIEYLVNCKDYYDVVEGINTLILGAGSEYYNNPEKYNIRFRGDKKEIYRKNPYYIHTDLWYSEEPYIDQEVRVKRLEKICNELYKQGINIGGFAERVLKSLKEKGEVEV